MIVRRINNDELYHHGIKGQRWGVRRYQNPDGSYTYAGKKHYGKGEKMDIHDGDSRTTQNVKRNYNTMSDDDFIRKYSVSKEKYRKRVNRYGDPYMNSPLAKTGKKLSKLEKNNSLYKKNVEMNKKMWNKINTRNQKTRKWIHDNPVMAATIAASSVAAAVGTKYVLKRRANRKIWNLVLDPNTWGL